ncbi:NCS2 family permease [Propionibacterium australiense]|uniref:NCS2 family permease n=1 Tax=Propionibacterium australiense TaxID=119981 RepID=A0A383S7A2_9ACTN|nr:NCS2 family permease [Propionibacterium australiense]RLP09480.1 NCS2 family permease [Propionibacterium australiense]RLP09942.1 NCS2 family permease [Propionibacterium australiense]SYZ33858.1 Permease family [Propionibacterium australiense]VEH92034.1 Guanine/hypoxanthine permease pbuG [Propionibacterium australiense]
MASVSPEKTLEAPSFVERWFRVAERGSSIGQELRGGLVTFFTMAYILALNPLVIGTAADSQGNLISGAPKFTDAAAGIVDQAAVSHSIAMVAAATALIAGISTILMGVIGRFPIGLAAGLGLNAMCAYVIAPNSTWPRTMGMILIEGIIITLLVLTGFREAVFRAVPRELRVAISVGIGLFVAFVGLVDANIVTPGSGTPVQLGLNGSLGTLPQLLFVIGLLILLFLYVRARRGAMLIAIIATTVIAIVVQALTRIPETLSDGSTNPEGWALNVPAWPGLSAFVAPDLGLFGRVDLVGAFANADGQFTLASVLGAVMLIFSLLLADFFDTVGTVVAVGAEGDILDENGEPPHLRGVLLADSLAAVLGGLGSTSSNTSYIESTAGVAEGARTGIASVFTGICFLLATFLSPLTNMVPSEAVAPVLVLVGFLMMQQVGEIDWHHLVDAIPAFITIVLMPFSYSISVGIGAGFVIFIVLKVFQGKARHIHPLMWVVGALFVIYFASDVINGVIASA